MQYTGIKWKYVIIKNDNYSTQGVFENMKKNIKGGGIQYKKHIFVWENQILLIYSVIDTVFVYISNVNKNLLNNFHTTYFTLFEMRQQP